jgi:uncharacterized RDD family membrane protein YckC
MYPLKRSAAYIIDYAIILTPTAMGLASLRGYSSQGLPGGMKHYLGFVGWGISLLVPALILGTMTGLTGRTPGKLVTFLRVQDYGGDPPGLAQGILREAVKAVSLACFFGMIFALQAVVTNRRTFYDEWLDLDVEDLRPAGLTPTQKNFRKFMREKQRRERRSG